MSPSYVCPCCFLNRISILRETGAGSGEKFQIQLKHQGRPMITSSEALSTTTLLQNNSNTTVSSQFAFSDASVDNMNHLQDVLDKLKADVTSIPNLSEQNMNYVSDKNYVSESSVDSSKKTISLTEQIEQVLREQKKFLRELNLDLPWFEEEWYMIFEDQKLEQNMGDVNWNSGKAKKVKNSEEDFMNLLKQGKLTDCFYAGGDKVGVSRKNSFTEIWKEETCYENRIVPKIDKPTMYFNEEPVKLPKPFQCTLTSNDSNFNKDYVMDKNISVKLLFFPEVALKGSSTSVFSDDCMSSASVYVTAANSVAESVQPRYTTASSSSSLQLKTTQSSTLLG